MINKQTVVTLDEIHIVLDEMLEITLVEMQNAAAQEDLSCEKIKRIFTERALLNRLKEIFKEKDIND